MVMVCKKAMLQSGQNQRAEPVGAETGPLELAQLKKIGLGQNQRAAPVKAERGPLEATQL